MDKGILRPVLMALKGRLNQRDRSPMFLYLMLVLSHIPMLF